MSAYKNARREAGRSCDMWLNFGHSAAGATAAWTSDGSAATAFG